tara:strand:+ start:693 stop:2141 length:1449 start_codon:yes stop_codon:yes gene_type:complete
MSNIKINEKVEKIKSLLKCEKDNEDFLNYLSEYLEKFQIENKERFSEKDILDNFIRNHSIYYNKTSQLYYDYIGGNFVSMNEDNILYLVLEYISNNSGSIDTVAKVSLKNKIMKQIKENNIYESIPDSNTIQETLSLLNETFFSKKAYSKCFLITIGRIILQKKVDNNFLIFTRANMKYFLNEMNKHISIYFCNTNLFNFFKFKYTQDHQQNKVKNIMIPTTKINSNNIKITEQNYINMIVVAIYYYNRYDTINNYFTSENVSTEVINNINYLNTDKSIIIKNFIEKNTIKEKKQQIPQKQLIFLWKKYAYENDIFVTSFTSYNDFIFELFQYLNVDFCKENNNNILSGYYSFNLPYVDDFKKFWNNNFIYSETETHFELNEILFLYNKHSKLKKNNINETLIKLIIQCFYPNYKITDNKIVNNIKSPLWDKEEEMKIFIEKHDINVQDNINIIYKRYLSTSKSEYRISKVYLQNYIIQLGI